MTQTFQPVARAAVFPVHHRRLAIDNRRMFGGSSSSAIVKRAAFGAGAAGGFGAIIAMFCGAMALLQLARAAQLQHAQTRALQLQSLRRAIVGNRKQQVAAVLGAPRATIGRGDFLTDDTWYYAIDERRHVALAIEFADGIARQTQVIAGM